MQSHPDADAFIRSYLAQPADVTTRVVFADWLDETGEPHNAAWAHFIRLKAEADRHDPDSRERRELDRQAVTFAPDIRARLTISARRFVGYRKSLLKLLPSPNFTVRLADFEVTIAVLELVPESVARENFVLPIDLNGNTLLTAATDARDTDLAQKLEFILNKDVMLLRAEREDLREAINRGFGPVYPESSMTIFREFEYRPLLPGDPSTLDWEFDPNAPVVRFLNFLFREAIDRRAYRVSLTPDPTGMAVRYRTDTESTDYGWIPPRMLRQVLIRLAIEANIPVEWMFTNPPVEQPVAGQFNIRDRVLAFSVHVTVRPAQGGPSTLIELIPDLISF